MRWTGTRVTAESAPCEKKNAAGGGPVVLFAALCASPINHLPVLVPHSVCVRGGPAARPPARRPPAGSSQNCATGPFARWLSAPVRSSTLGLVYLSVVFFLVSTRFPVPTPGSTFMIKRERTETFFFFHQIGCRTYVKPLIYSPIEPRLLKEISC